MIQEHTVILEAYLRFLVRQRDILVGSASDHHVTFITFIISFL